MVCCEFDKTNTGVGGKVQTANGATKIWLKAFLGREGFFVGVAGYVLSFCLQLGLRFGFPI